MAKKDKTNRNIKAAKKFEHDLPAIAARHHIRVSNPYGYYPEDVDKVITNFEDTINELEHENKELRDQLEEVKKNLTDSQTEMTKLRMQMSLMEFPDTSAEEDFIAISQIGRVTGNNEPQTGTINKPLNKQTAPYVEPVTLETENSTQQPAVYDNLVSGIKKSSNPNKKKLKL